MKPSLPQGTRDFNALTVWRREYIFDTIKEVFELFGFEPLQTPAMENLTTLTGKYGEEGDRLIFKILNNGLNEAAKHEKATLAFQNILAGKSDANLTERALRYDLTIPFARFVSMNRNEIALPYKRYQMQPVWRADRPQKGRYREFWQCDADIVGTNSLLMEAELLQIYYKVFSALKLNVSIRINNRKLLAALAEVCGAPDSMNDITVAIDKLDKIQWQGVSEELSRKGISEQAIELIQKYLSISGDNGKMIEEITQFCGHTSIGAKGIEELKSILHYTANMNAKVELDFTLARGLDYYTGMICEVKSLDENFGSIGGGGRYDNLTGVFDYPGVSGVGISFGVDRIYDVMEKLNLFPESVGRKAKYFFLNLSPEGESKSLELLSELRAKNIAAEIYPDQIKMDKQLKYAHKRGYEYVIIMGEDEIASDMITIKNFITGEQIKKKVSEFLLSITES